MTAVDFAAEVRAEMRRIGLAGRERVPADTPRLARPELRFRPSGDGRLAEFRRTGWPVLVLTAALAAKALRKVGKGAGAEAVWRALGTACE